MDSIVIDMAGRRLGLTWALRDVTLEIARGEILGVFGRAGSGKTALLRLIAGLDQPSAGCLFMQSSTVGDNSWLDAHVAIALQKPGLAPELTVSENLRLTASLWATARKGRTGRIAMFTELMDLVDVKNRRAGQLSEGQRAATEIARALVARADITLIDGLVDRLDHPTRRRLWEYIKVSSRRGATFIVGTSKCEDAELCDRLAVLASGKIAFVGTADELKSSAQSEYVVVESLQNPLLKSNLQGRFGVSVSERKGNLEFATRSADSNVARVISEFGSDVGAVYVRSVTLDDALDIIEGDR